MEAKGRGDLAATGASNGGRKHGHVRGEERDEHAGDEAVGVHGPRPRERGERGGRGREVGTGVARTPCSLTACAMGTTVAQRCSRSSSYERSRQARMAAARSPWARRRARRDREQGRRMGRETVERLEKRNRDCATVAVCGCPIFFNFFQSDASAVWYLRIRD